MIGGPTVRHRFADIVVAVLALVLLAACVLFALIVSG